MRFCPHCQERHALLPDGTCRKTGKHVGFRAKPPKRIRKLLARGKPYLVEERDWTPAEITKNELAEAEHFGLL